MNDDFTMPFGLSKDGQKAWKAIVMILLSEDFQMSGGGCKAFRSPDFHLNTQGESYGKGSELIVVYDGGDHRRFFTLDEGDYEACNRIQMALGALGMRLEECTGWYAAVYKD